MYIYLLSISSAITYLRPSMYFMDGRQPDEKTIIKSMTKYEEEVKKETGYFSGKA